MTPARRLALLPLAALGAGCTEMLPTAESDDLVRGGIAVEVRLPASDFLDRVRVYGGYGRASELGGGFIAHRFGAGADPAADPGLEAATLLRFGRYPSVVTVNDTTGTSRPDSSLTFLSARIVARFDTLGSVHSGPVAIRADATTEAWDGISATWDHAVDTLLNRVPWSQPGGGALQEMGEWVWDPEAGDSLIIELDSARVASWSDTADLARGVRLSTEAPGVRLQLRSALMWIETMPSLNPDTLIQVLAGTDAITFIYDPVPTAPERGMRIGGAPAWRTVLDLDIPPALDGPPALCAQLGCPLELSEDHISYAALRLTTQAEQAAFAPSDTISIDLRMVMVPSVLPKSPLGPSLSGIAGVILSPEWFAPPGGHVVEVPVTGLVQDLLRGETADGDPVSTTVALLSTFEPLSIEYASFEGIGAAPGGPARPGEPELRLILNYVRGR
ncbi:MAG: hypothetical protein F4Y07_16725 [Gemmatimonadetes bacterium]|nr:hypothetical protein [Gemmatimonadota bacterium]